MLCAVSDTPSILHVQDVAKKFVSGTREIEVLKKIDLDMRRGESLSIRGESGSGKTTLLNIISGLESLDKGEIKWGNDAIASLPPSIVTQRRAKWIGMVFQAFYLIPEMNALENVLFASRILGKTGQAERDRARNLLERVGLGERIDSSPLKLSGGERQRVALARALMNRPALILADEPTGNLDERTGERVMDLLLEVCAEEGTSLILVTHNPEFSKRTDRCIFLHDGVLHDNEPS